MKTKGFIDRILFRRPSHVKRLKSCMRSHSVNTFQLVLVYLIVKRPAEVGSKVSRYALAYITLLAAFPHKGIFMKILKGRQKQTSFVTFLCDIGPLTLKLILVPDRTKKGSNYR